MREYPWVLGRALSCGSLFLLVVILVKQRYPDIVPPKKHVVVSSSEFVPVLSYLPLMGLFTCAWLPNVRRPQAVEPVLAADDMPGSSGDCGDGFPRPSFAAVLACAAER